MPSIRKLTPDEVQERKHGKMSKRALVSREYDEMLGQFAIGDWGEVVVDPSEKRLTIRNRLQAAAERKEVKLRFFRTQGPVIRFEVQLPSSDSQGDASDDDEEYLPQPGPEDASTAGDEGEEAEAVFLPAPGLEAATQGEDVGQKRGPGRPRKARAEGEEAPARKRPGRPRRVPAEAE
jgi:hypothetical protein